MPSYPITVKAEISLSNIYISVTDAKTALQDKDTKAFEAHFKDIKENWSKVNKKDHKLVKTINNDIENIEKSNSNDEKIKSLNTLTTDLIDYEKVLNPVDKQAKRDKLQNQMQPLIKEMGTAISNKDFDKAVVINNKLNSTWTNNEKIVRKKILGVTVK